VDGSLVAITQGRRSYLSWSGFTDATSGVASYRLVGAAGASAPSCASGPILYEGSAQELSHPGLAYDTRWSYRVCALDEAGNVSPGAAVTVTR
jgi:chitodextrinase